MGYGRTIELWEDQYDPSYEGDQHGIFLVSTCQRCGALIDSSAQAEHSTWHDRIEASCPS